MSMPLSSAPRGYNTFSTLNPQQQKIFGQLSQSNLGDNQLFQGGQKFLQDLYSGSPEAIQKFQAPYLRQFHEQTIPKIAERFAGLGAGAQSSSAFQQALGQAGAGLSENLAALQGQMQLGGLGQALGYAQAPFEQQRSLLDINTQGLAKKPQSFLQQLLFSLLSGASEGGTRLAGQALGLG